MPTPTVKLLQQIDDMFNDSQATTNQLEWDNSSFLERRLGELMREHDAHSVIAAMLLNYDIMRKRLKYRERLPSANASQTGGCIRPIPAQPTNTTREPPKPSR